MKVTCKNCSASFKVKTEVTAGKAFKFKCPKCAFVNKLFIDEDTPIAAPQKAGCEDCGLLILKPESGPALCDQCRASRAVAEARKKSQALMDDSDVEYPDDYFEEEEKPAAKKAARPAVKEEPVSEEPFEFADEEKPGKAKAEKKIEKPAEEKPAEKIEAAPAVEEKKKEEEPAAKIEEKEKEAEKPKAEAAAAEEKKEEKPPEQAEEKAAAKEEKEPEKKPEEPAKKEEKPPEKTGAEEKKKAEDDLEFTFGDTINDLPDKSVGEATDIESARYEVRSEDGLVIGAIKLETLRDLILAKKVQDSEECRRNDGPWLGMLELPEVFRIFETQKAVKPEESKDKEPTQEQLRSKLLESLKVRKKCDGCGAEIYVIEDNAHPMCDQCRIEALVLKKKSAKPDDGDKKYTVRNPDGLLLGPLRKETLVDLINAGNIQGREEIKIDNGDWKPIADVAELSDLLGATTELIELTETLDG